MRLNNVLLPEPFGPMMPRTSPDRTASSTLDTAVNPPKRLLRFLTSSSIEVGLGLPRLAYGLEAPAHEEIVDDAADAARHEDHHQHDHRAEHDHTVLVIVARQ